MATLACLWSSTILFFLLWLVEASGIECMFVNIDQSGLGVGVYNCDVSSYSDPNLYIVNNK